MTRLLGACLLLFGLLLIAPPGQAGTAACTISGTSGPDVLVGTRQADVICGRAGADVIRGEGGNDLMLGGSGADRLYGGPGTDRLLGGSGDDRLGGGKGVDTLDGADGDDRCVYNSSDRMRSCTWDLTPPEIVEVRQSASTIDVSTGRRTVTLRVHVRDDAGVARLQGFLLDSHVDGAELWQPNYELVSGTPRNGWFRNTETIPAGFPPTLLNWSLTVSDVRSRSSYGEALGTVKVLDDHPDLRVPRVSIVSPRTPTTYDARGGDVRVVVKARVQDAETGVAPTYLQICTDHDFCDEFPTLVSGDLHDGIWRGVLTIPRGTATGDLHFYAFATDRARPDAYLGHYGDTEYIYHRFLTGAGSPEYHLVGGDLTHQIRGPVADPAPTFGSFSMSPTSLTRPGTVDFAVTASSDASAVEVVLFTMHEGTLIHRRFALHLDGDSWRGSWAVTKEPWNMPGDWYPIVLYSDAPGSVSGLAHQAHTRYVASAAANTLLGTRFPEVPGDPTLTISDPPA